MIARYVNVLGARQHRMSSKEARVTRLSVGVAAFVLSIALMAFAGWRYEMPPGIVLLMMGLIAAFVGLVWWAAASIERSEAERRRAEHALTASEQTFSTMFRSLPVAAVLARYSDGAIVDCNDAFVTMTGFGRGEVAGRTSAEFGLVRDEPVRQKALDMVRRQGGARNIEVKSFRKDGEPRDLMSSVNVIELQGTKYVLSSIADITERKRAEEALRRTTQFDEAVMANMGEGLYTVNSEGLVTFMNPMAEKLFGWTIEELRGRKMHDMTHYKHPDGSPFPAAECAGLQVLREGKTLTDHEDVFIRKDGSFFDVVYSSSPFREGGQITGLVVVFRDVTERKRAEEALRESERRFKRAAEAAESANNLKDQFLATLSHELRTPLNAILGYTRMVRTGAIPDARRQGALEIIERNAIVQNQLVEDLLDISRITTGRVRLDMKTVPVIGPLQEAIESTRPTAEAKRVVLEVKADPLAGAVSADRGRLQQVFWNLLSNAVKFTPSGGRVAVSLDAEEDLVRVIVRDTGIGIPPEFLPHVFEPFRQADGGFSREFGGLGLGLAICRQLIDLHGGNLTVDSAGSGQGATFTVRLPRMDPVAASIVLSPGVPSESTRRLPAPLTPVAAPATRAELEGLDVLVVDDEEDSLGLLRQLLENAGAVVRTASNAPEALREFDRHAPRLLVADLGLPQIDGYELLRQIRSRRGDGDSVAAVAVTAYARLDDRFKALAAGFQDHVPKPIDPETFLAAVIAAANHRA
jgi:PAS domain S-box-containing protein